MRPIPQVARGKWEKRRFGREHTSWLIAESLPDNTLLLEIDVPALGLARLVLEGEREDRVALLDGVGALSRIRLQGGVDEVEGLGGRECGCSSSMLAIRRYDVSVGDCDCDCAYGS
jgi:hypothetical protein